ncbi:MAG TPA: hypothetical protein VM925_02790 [Labilithrix sp.]|jgi:hypothetical protein|nr:hypothetical protein [Labilithrix sp.]
MSTEKTARALLLEQTALGTARDWAAAFRLELAREGRAAEGGWPGTLSEARTRAGEQFRKALAVRSMTAPAHDELDLVAKLTTEHARRAWRTA